MATAGIHVRLRFKMRGGEAGPAVYRFGGFELETGPGELRKRGTRIKLQDQPLQILVLLLEHAGEVATREQIQNRLWPPGAYVDYDNAINSAVRKLREALGDTSENPRYIETMARRGYRFIGHLDAPSKPDQPPPAPPSSARIAKTTNISRRSVWWSPGSCGRPSGLVAAETAPGNKGRYARSRAAYRRPGLGNLSESIARR
jgi:DNA-binding winged helix-turn-helix (wHTH) protein